jgi:endoglucanase
MLLLSAATCVMAAPGAALADSPTSGVPVCSATENLLNGLGSGLGLGDADNKGEVGFSAASYTADEDTGQFWITITRTSTSGEETLYYGVNQSSAQAPWDFTLVPASEAVLAPGQASCQFPVTIVDNGMNGPSVTAIPYLWGSSRAALPADPDRTTLTILRNDPLATRDPTNPLDLATTPTNGDPLSGAQFYVAPATDTAAGKAMKAEERAHDTSAVSADQFIAAQPFAYRYWYWNTQTNTSENLAHYLQIAQDQEPGSVVELSTYSLPHGARDSTATLAFAKHYLNWIRNMAAGIGNFRVVMFFELDSLIQAPRMTPAARHIRLVDELKPAIQILESECPHLVLYLDAGSSDGLKATRAADYLRQAGIYAAQGFFLNSTHFNWDTTEIQQGQQISKLLGGTHFLISSGVNGRGPQLMKEAAGPVGPQSEHLAENLCNPVGAGLGTMSTQTGFKALDGLLWFAPVGNSGGQGGSCGKGAPVAASWWNQYAIDLYNNRRFGVTGPKLALQRSGTYEPYSAAFAG